MMPYDDDPSEIYPDEPRDRCRGCDCGLWDRAELEAGHCYECIDNLAAEVAQEEGPPVENHIQKLHAQRATLNELAAVSAKTPVTEAHTIATAIYSSAQVICSHLESIARAIRDRGQVPWSAEDIYFERCCRSAKSVGQQCPHHAEEHNVRVVSLDLDEEQVRWLAKAIQQCRNKDQKNAARFGDELDPESPIAWRLRVGNEVADILKEQVSFVGGV